MKDFHSTVTIPHGSKVELLLDAFKKNHYSTSKDRVFLEMVIQRNVSLMSNIELTLNQAMKSGTSVEVSIVQKSERLWRECNEQNVELKLFLGVDGETTQLYGLKARQKMRAERTEACCQATANCSVRLSSPHRDYSLYRGRSSAATNSPSRLRALSPAAFGTTPPPMPADQKTSRSNGRITPSRNSPARVVASPAPKRLEDIAPPNRDLMSIPQKGPPVRRQSPAQQARVAATTMGDPLLEQTTELIKAGQATTNDIKECHRLFKKQHGPQHGNSRFVTWLSQFPSNSLEGLLDGLWNQ